MPTQKQRARKAKKVNSTLAAKVKRKVEKKHKAKKEKQERNAAQAAVAPKVYKRFSINPTGISVRKMDEIFHVYKSVLKNLIRVLSEWNGCTEDSHLDDKFFFGVASIEEFKTNLLPMVNGLYTDLANKQGPPQSDFVLFTAFDKVFAKKKGEELVTINNEYTEYIESICPWGRHISVIRLKMAVVALDYFYTKFKKKVKKFIFSLMQTLIRSLYYYLELRHVHGSGSKNRSIYLREDEDNQICIKYFGIGYKNEFSHIFKRIGVPTNNQGMKVNMFNVNSNINGILGEPRQRTRRANVERPNVSDTTRDLLQLDITKLESVLKDINHKIKIAKAKRKRMIKRRELSEEEKTEFLEVIDDLYKLMEERVKTEVEKKNKIIYAMSVDTSLSSKKLRGKIDGLEKSYQKRVRDIEEQMKYMQTEDSRFKHNAGIEEEYTGTNAW